LSTSTTTYISHKQSHHITDLHLTARISSFHHRWRAAEHLCQFLIDHPLRIHNRYANDDGDDDDDDHEDDDDDDHDDDGGGDDDDDDDDDDHDDDGVDDDDDDDNDHSN